MNFKQFLFIYRCSFLLWIKIWHKDFHFNFNYNLSIKCSSFSIYIEIYRSPSCRRYPLPAFQTMLNHCFSSSLSKLYKVINNCQYLFADLKSFIFYNLIYSTLDIHSELFLFWTTFCFAKDSYFKIKQLQKKITERPKMIKNLFKISNYVIFIYSRLILFLITVRQ